MARGQWVQVQFIFLWISDSLTGFLLFLQVASLEYRTIKNTSIAVFILWAIVGLVTIPVFMSHSLKVSQIFALFYPSPLANISTIFCANRARLQMGPIKVQQLQRIKMSGVTLMIKITQRVAFLWLSSFLVMPFLCFWSFSSTLECCIASGILVRWATKSLKNLWGTKNV